MTSSLFADEELCVVTTEDLPSAPATAEATVVVTGLMRDATTFELSEVVQVETHDGNPDAN